MHMFAAPSLQDPAVSTPCLGYGDDASLIEAYAASLRNGLSPASEDTIRTYLGELRNFMRLATYPPGTPLAARITRAAMVFALTKIPTARASSRRNMFYAVRSFARFLRDMEIIPEESFQAISGLRLKVRSQPVRKTLSQDQLETLLRVIMENECSTEVERITNLALVATLALTGLRNSELCKLSLADVDFEAGLITVRHGKGGKQRIVGLPNRLVPLLRLYLEVRPESAASTFFVGPSKGEPLNRDAIVKRLARISKKVGFPVAAHMFRRSFATTRAHQGVPLDKLQVLLGHADIKTTRDYVQTRPVNVAQEMREW